MSRGILAALGLCNASGAADLADSKHKRRRSKMRTFKLLGALLAVLALAAIASATASAEEILWKWLPGKAGETFKGGSGKATLTEKGGATISCKKSETKAKEGELLEEGATEGKDAILGLAFIHFSGCTAFGVATNSLGDSSGIILVHAEIHDCLIAPNHFGLLIKPLPVHLEVPLVGTLLVVTGDFVALVEPAGGTTPNKVWNLNITQAGGVQTIEKCEGGEKETLLTETNHNGTQVQSGEEAKEGSIEFEKEAQTAMT
jgi:hypothetical protein